MNVYDLFHKMDNCDLKSIGCSDATSHRRLFASWSRPVCVKAPLGIVSAVEVCFAIMFVALLAWSLGNYLYISFGALHMHKAGEKV